MTTTYPEADAICSIADVRAAADRIRGHAVRTPLLRNAALDALTGGTILLKPEMLQHIGAFKFRGAYNRLAQIPAQDRPKGVVAWSSGNHAQGVAMAARLFGMPATIVMPKDTPAMKLANTRALGATVREYDRYTENREAIGSAIAAERGATVVAPYDDRGVMAGQGTIGIEIIEDAQAMGLAIDDAVVCCGGGGLIAGTSTAIRALSPATRVWAAEPATHDDTRRSLELGERVANDPNARSICDAIVTPMPGELTFAVNKARLAGGLAVTDEEALDAVAFARDVLKLVVEPGGAVALACVLSGTIDAKGKTIAVVLSGGNIDAETLAKAKRISR
ncbi:MAG: pyridoxal-5'-phosphate-dependent protein [Rhizobiales bacterium 65-9]|nr:threonine/serine dehydratase [Hyphomicrobiales bacterium]OJY37218.1 MAG: pyridoxal-5'-phosphate-dependent protein [Rhizobiales bacterium 65-9]